MNNKSHSKSTKSSKGAKFDSRKRKGKYDPKDKFDENQTKEAFGNDISWYVNNPQMLQDACNLSFANVLSKDIAFNPGTVGSTPYSYDLNCPGVLAMEILPTIGSVLRKENQYQSGDMWDSAVNMAARAEWSFIRQKNAGAKNYDAPDLMMYHLAMDNIYMFWSWMVRIYGYLRLYSFKNKYYPYGILRAMGLTDAAIEDLRGNMADFRTYINLMAAQMSSFAVPINLPYVKRHLWLFQNAFTDASTTKAQVYLYNPIGFYKLEEVTDEPMSLSFVERPSFEEPGALNRANWTIKAMKAVGDQLLSAIVKSESCNIMSGDILKAYESSGIYGFQSIPDDFSLMPVYDETVLSQIHNANFVVATTPYDTAIKQDSNIDAGYIYQYLDSGAASPNEVVIDTRFETPTPTDVMYATRLTCVSNPSDDRYISCGSELCVGMRIYTDASNGSSIIYGSISGDIYTVNPRAYTGTVNGVDSEYVTLDDFQQFQLFVGTLSKFDWHPIILMRSRLQDPGENADLIQANVFGDVDNFAIAENTTIDKIHRVALNSEFGLPYTLTSIK